MHLFIIILKEADTGFEHTKFVSVSFNLLVIQNHNIDGGGRYEEDMRERIVLNYGR